MNTALGIFGVGTITYFAAAESNQIEQKNRAFQQAKALCGEKGIINLGCGPYKHEIAHCMASDVNVVCNVDMHSDGDGMPNYQQVNLESMPYPFTDKQFGVSFASHILEHLENWEEALMEMRRISDHVVLVLPHPLYIANHVHPYHKQHFGFEDLEALREYEEVWVYV